MGFDKALLRLSDGRLLVGALAGELAGQFGETILVTNDGQKFKSQEELKPFRLVEDLRPGSGPAGAVGTALETLKNRPLFVMAGDMNFIDWLLIKKMAELLVRQNADMVVPLHRGFYEPLYAFYGPNTAAPLETTAKAGSGAPMEIAGAVAFKSLDLEDEELPEGLFLNLNTPEQLKAQGTLTLKTRRAPTRPSYEEKGE
jgi:molybdopterin-guanine dinucleotide biosynthesis protein A